MTRIRRRGTHKRRPISRTPPVTRLQTRCALPSRSPQQKFTPTSDKVKQRKHPRGTSSNDGQVEKGVNEWPDPKGDRSVERDTSKWIRSIGADRIRNSASGLNTSSVANAPFFRRRCAASEERAGEIPSLRAGSHRPSARFLRSKFNVPRTLTSHGHVARARLYTARRSSIIAPGTDGVRDHGWLREGSRP